MLATISPLDGRAFSAVEFATQRFALISSSGGGKSYGCGRIVEDLFDANVPVVVVDTVGIWPAVRLAADGKSAGLPFVIVGGEHADVPFVPEQAGALARFLISQNAHAVVDVSDLMPDERAEPLAVFFETALIEIKSSRRPRFFVLDEAQDLVPERAGKGEARLVRAVSAFVRKSRNHMCGSALLTQRPQDVSKSVLNQVGNLFVGMLFGEHERKAIERWVSSKANSPDAHAQLKRLAELQPGDFYFWSPSWQKTFGKFRFAPKRTFDGSSATPMDPHAVHGKLAPVDVAALRDLLAPPALPIETWAVGAVERGLEENTRLLDELDDLRARLDEANERAEALGRQLDHAAACAEAASVRFQELRERVRHSIAIIGEASNDMQAVAMPTLDLPKPPAAPLPKMAHEPPFRLKDGYLDRQPKPAPKAKAKPTKVSRDPGGVDELDNYSETLVAAVKAYGPITRRQLSLVTGVSGQSSTFSTALGKLHADGWIQTLEGKLVAHPESLGFGTAPRLERGRAVRMYWRAERFDDYQRKLFDAAFDQRDGLTRKDLAKAAGVSAVSSTFSTALGWFKRVGVFDYSGGKVSLSADARWAMRG